MDADPIYLEPQGYSVIWPVLGFFIIFGLLVWAVWIAAVAYSLRAHRAEVAAEATATRDSDERELVGEPV